MLTDAATRAMDFAAVSHLGHARVRNEDCCYVAADKGLAIVADGVGGQGDGAWASRRAVELISQSLEGVGATHDAGAAVLDVLQRVHAQMFQETRTGSGKPSGTTIAGIWAPEGSHGPLTIFNVGDSPVYLHSKGRLTKLSHDHSLYQLWLDGGRVGREPAKRMIMQALGISEQLAPHIAKVQVESGDSVLICTDGLSGAVPLERMTKVLAGKKSSQNACDILVCDALAGTASDNVTVSVCRF